MGGGRNHLSAKSYLVYSNDCCPLGSMAGYLTCREHLGFRGKDGLRYDVVRYDMDQGADLALVFRERALFDGVVEMGNFFNDGSSYLQVKITAQ